MAQRGVAQIVEGTDYGYPSGRSGMEMATVGGYGTAALRWHDDGLLIGSCFQVWSVTLADRDGTYRALQRPTEIAEVEGCVTAIEPLANGTTLVATFYHNAMRFLRP